jgi:hypothetical protein
MTVQQIICGGKAVSRMEVVWRNPHRLRCHSRRHSRESNGGSTHYLLQEFVDNGCFSYWTTISDFEVVVGGRAA